MDPSPPVTVLADLVANVLSVAVEAGDVVEEGDTLLVVESMKMEIPVTAPRPGRVRRVGVAPGDVVQEGDLLVELTP